MPRTGNQPESNQADNPLFFYMPDAEWGEFCQWHEPSFTISKAEISDLVGYTVDETDPNGAIAFNCAEQFMMCCKAARFHDIPTQDQVLAASSPKEQRRLGKNVDGFTNESGIRSKAPSSRQARRRSSDRTHPWAENCYPQAIVYSARLR
ncbi:hypothetical protein CLIM01_03666 [Colletotrichum limetticola]|uniref:NADAR domain-containing protein n=1 Tax=Colletotrichum limetticola TaxID=1209924 RepID=A0ABQ9Q5B5_9PEZI|nr:hypothetical protein CLIM01_03666 [Colletotrichum limetticola]